MNSIFRLRKHKPKTEIISAADAAATDEAAVKSAAAVAAAAAGPGNNNSNSSTGKSAGSSGAGGAKLILDAVRWEASVTRKVCVVVWFCAFRKC